MLKLVIAVALSMTFGAGSTAWAQDLPDLKVVKVEIVPNSEKDLTDTFFRGRPLIEMAPALDKGGDRLQLPTYRQYRLIVTIQNVGKAKTASPFLVRTECVRDGKSVVLGKGRVSMADPSNCFACYVVFPAEAGPGDCLIRTIVDADTEIKESDRSNNDLEFKASIVK